MEIILKNIQSIENAVYSLPQKGLVQIVGDNSNGKSIIVKAIGAVVGLKILDEEERNALIRDTCSSGSITMMFNSKVLHTILDRERGKCAVYLMRENGEKIIRTFRDGGITELIHEFGFRCYSKNSVCLQLYETFGLMPFVNTSKTTNSEIVESITEDNVAKTFLNNFKNFTHPKAREQIKALNRDIDNLQRTKDAMLLFNYMKYDEYHKKLLEYYNLLKHLQPICIQAISIPPIVKTYEVRRLDVKKLAMVPIVKTIGIKPLRLKRQMFLSIIPTLTEIWNIGHIIEHLVEIRNGKCPTCGHALLEDLDEK